MKETLKKKLFVIIPLAIVLIGGITFAIIKNKQNAAPAPAPTTTKKKISSPVNLIPVSERPYVRLEPSSDGHYISITIQEVKKTATNLEYEMEYQTGSMLQGFGGALSLSKLPVIEKKLFGSQSAGGAITYHEDIKGGNLELQFAGSENYAVKSAWRYFTNTAKESKFSSQDAKFSISNADLSKYSYIVIYNSPGFPGKLKQELLSDPYVVSSDRDLKAISSSFEIGIRHNGAGTIMGYDGQEWQELETSFADGINTASGPLMDVYVLVQQ